LLAIKADMQTAADALRSALAEVESSLKTRGGIEPPEQRKLLEEIIRVIGPNQTSATSVRCRSCGFVWDAGGPAHHAADCLHMRARSLLGQDSAAPSGAARPLTSEEEEAAWDSITEQECSCCTAAVRLFCRINGIALADSGVPSVLLDAQKGGNSDG
jgi:hypothetical protein